MLCGMLLFIIFQIPVALARNLTTLFVCRFLSGVFGSASLAINAGIYVDIWDPFTRGYATMVRLASYIGGV